MALSQLNFAGLNRVEVAIARIKEFEPPEGYYLADSYGKDSSVCRHLIGMAGSKHDAHYSQGGIDPPELVYFGRKNHPETLIERPAMSVWKAVLAKGLPRRQSRWCCEMIKEQEGAGRRVVTGIRWQESPRRAKRRMVEVCRTDETKIFVSPIIDWTENDVWEFIKAENIPYCSLYDETYYEPRKRKVVRRFKRLGCVLCPMETAKQTQFELVRFPKLAEAWRQAGTRFWERHTEGTARWKTAEEFWLWWISRKGEAKVNNAQCVMFDN